MTVHTLKLTSYSLALPSGVQVAQITGGAQGPQGVQGVKGDKGDTGNTGITVSSVPPAAPTVNQLWLEIPA
jgi:hypothetical protein